MGAFLRLKGKGSRSKNQDVINFLDLITCDVRIWVHTIVKLDFFLMFFH
jgi:hypothetical protein